MLFIPAYLFLSFFVLMLFAFEELVELLLRVCADALHLLSLLVLIVKMKRTRSCSGISLRSQILYLSVYLLRYVDMIYFILYPKILFSSPRMIYNGIMKIVFIALQSHVIFKMTQHFFYSYDSEFDDTPISYIAAFALISGACLFTNRHAPEYNTLKCIIDWMWASSVVLEAVSILPQLTLLHKAGEGETLTVHYVLFLGLYRFLYMITWIINWLFTGRVKSHLLLWGSVIQTLLYSELFVVYSRSFIAKGKSFKVNPKAFIKDAFAWKEDA